MKSIALKPVLLMLLTLISLASLYTLGVQKQMTHVVPEAIEDVTWSIAAAISQKEYGLGEYLYYIPVINALEGGGMTKSPFHLENLGITNYPKNLYNKKLMNKALQGAIGLDLSHEMDNQELGATTRGLPATDIGMVDFYVLAFSLFGYDVGATYPTLFVLLAIMMGAYLLAFYRQSVFILSLPFMYLGFLAFGFYYIDTVNNENLAVPYNSRFMAVYALLPTLHMMLACLLSDRHSLSQLALVGLQSALLFFVITTRSSAMWCVLAMMALWALIVLYGAIKQRQFSLGHLKSAICGHRYLLLIVASIIAPLLWLKHADSLYALINYDNYDEAIRMVTHGVLLVLLTAAIGWLVRYWVRAERSVVLSNAEQILKQRNWAPLFVMLCAVLLCQTWQQHKLDAGYSTDDMMPHHMRYHSAYMALWHDPYFAENYSKGRQGDSLSFLNGKDYFEEKYPDRKYLSDITRTFKTRLHDDTLKEMYFDYLAKRPMGVLHVHQWKFTKLWHDWHRFAVERLNYLAILGGVLFFAALLAALKAMLSARRKLNCAAALYTCRDIYSCAGVMALCIIFAHAPPLFAYPSEVTMAGQLITFSMGIALLTVCAMLLLADILMQRTNQKRAYAEPAD